MDLLAILQQNQRAMENRAAQAGLKPTVSPDVLGQAVEGQPVTGIEPSSVIADPTPYIKAFEQQSAAARLQGAANTAGWMDEDPVNARLIYDDLKGITDLEKFSNNYLREQGGGNASVIAKSTLLKMQSIFPNAQLALNQGSVEFDGNQLDERSRNMQRIDAALQAGEEVDIASLPEVDRLFYERYSRFPPEARAAERERLVADYAWQKENQDHLRSVIEGYQDQQGYLYAGRTTNLTDIRDLSGVYDYATLTVGGGVVDILASFAASAVGGVGGYAVGGPVGATIGAGIARGAYGGSMSFNEINSTLAASDAPYTTKDVKRALLMSAASAGVEVAFGSSARLAGKGLAKLGLREAYSEVTQETLERVSQGYLRRIGREYIANGAEEFFQEGAQYFLEQYGVQGGNFKFDDQTLLGAFNASMAGFFAGGAVGGSVGIRSAIALERASQHLVEAGQTVRTMEQLSAIAKDLKLADRSPSKFKELAERLGLGNIPVFYQAEALDNQWRSQGLNPETEITKLGGNLADYQAALASNGRVAITAEGLVRSGLKGDSAAFLTENGSFTPEGYSPKDMKNYTAILNEVKQEVAMQDDLSQMPPERRQVYSNIYSQLRAAGRTDREAEADATMATAFFETMAARYGDASTVDMYNRFGLDIKGPEQMAREAAAQAAQAAAIPDDVVTAIDTAVNTVEAGQPLQLDLNVVPPQAVQLLRDLGVDISEDGTIPAEQVQQVRDAVIGMAESQGGDIAGSTLNQSPVERLADRGPLRSPRGETYMGVGPQYTVENSSQDAPNAVRGSGMIMASTNALNADAQSEALDALLAAHQDPLSSEEAWVSLANDAYSLDRVPMPPFRTISIMQEGPQAITNEISKLSDGMRRDAEEGLKTAKAFGEVYASGEATVDITAKAFLWSFLSRGVSPYVQEGAFLDAIVSNTLTSIMQRAAKDGWSEQLNVEYAEWAKGAIPKGSAGRGTQHNLNAFGNSFMRVMTQRHEDAGGKTGLEIIHDMIASGVPSYLIRREFLKRGDGAGIDNKVVSFTLLLLGRDDVLVLDRVQVRNQWNDGRFDGQNIYDSDLDAEGKQVTGTAFAAMTFGHKGLLYYETMERALKPVIEEGYRALGIEGSLGRYHWDSWLAASNQEVGHASVEGLLRDAQGEPSPYTGAFVRQGKYMNYDYGFRYGVLPDGTVGTVVELLGGNGATVIPAEVMGDPKSPMRKVLSKLSSAAKKRGEEFGVTRPWVEALTDKERTSYDQAVSDAGTPAPHLWQHDPHAAGRTDAAAGRVLYQSSAQADAVGGAISATPAGVRGDGTEQGGAASEKQAFLERRNAATPDVARAEDLASLGDPAALEQFINKSGWGVVTATLGADEFITSKEEGPLKDMLLARHAEKNLRENAYLKSLLDQAGIPYVILEGMYKGEPDGTSFLIIADEDTVIKFGKRFNQDSVLTKDGLVFTSRPQPDVSTTGDIMVGKGALEQDFYSVTPQGLEFSLGLDWDRTGAGKPSIPDGYVEDMRRPQLPINSDGKVELYHWSDAELTTVDPAMAGTGPLRGAEIARGAKLSFFGINPKERKRDQGTGYVKEGGLGDYLHMAEVDPEMLYPIFEDPDGLVVDGDLSASERAIKAAGYLGYYTTDDGSTRAPLGNVAAMFGPTDVALVQAPDRTLEQRKEATGPRGSITFPTAGVDGNTSIIKLFGEADRSTFTHEMGHFFLEAFKVLANDQRAPQAMREDWATINEWLGRDPADTSPFTVEQHEQWARGFEAYVMDGNAPSVGMRSAFSRFKRWLTSIYRDVVNLQVELSPEVREVMDRMLATDEQIALAKAEQQIGILFAIKPDGMSQADYDAYRKAAVAADDIAHERILSRLMLKIKVERSRVYRDAKKQARTEAEKEVDALPVYALVNRLQSGEIRLNREQIVDMFGEAALKDISRTKLGGKTAIYAPSGTDVAVVAELAGYSDPTEMMLELMGAQKRSTEIELRVTDKLNQQFGDDYTSAETLREAAVAELHNDARASTLSREAKEIERQAKASGVTLRPTSLDRLRAQAKDMINDMSMRQAAAANSFLLAERKAGLAAQRAFADVVKQRNRTTGTQEGKSAKDMLREAHRAKQQQLLNHFLYIEARKVEASLATARKLVARLEKASSRTKIASPYIDRIMDLLHQYDLRPTTKKQLAARNSLNEFIAMMTEAGREGELAIPERVIQRASRKHYSTLTVEEFAEVIDSVKNLEHLGRTKMKLLDAKKNRDFAKVKGELISTVETSLTDNPPDMIQKAGDRRKFAAQAALNSILTADTIINKLDGNTRTVGAVWHALKESISRGISIVQKRHEQAAKDISKLFSDHYSTKELEALRSKQLAVTSIGRTLPKSAILAVALNTGNRDNMIRLTDPNNQYHFGKSEVAAMLAEHMDERDWRFVQSVWDYIGSYWPEIAAQEKALTGVSPKGITAQLQVSAPSFVTGGYYPIRYDPRLSGRVSDIDHNEALKNLKAGRTSKAQTPNGHTKERVSATGHPLRLELDIISSHVNDVIYDLEMRQPIQNTWRLLNDKDVTAVFNRKDATAELNALRLWVQDVANGDKHSAGGFNSALAYLRGGLSISKMAFSITTLVQQPTGLLQSAVVVGKVPMANALWKYKNNPVRHAAAVTAMSDMMASRQQTFQRDILALQQAVAIDPTTGKLSRGKQWFIAAGFYLIQKSQFYIVDVPTWMAAYDKELRSNGGDTQAAALVADQIVARSQGSGILSDRTAFERGTLSEKERGSELARLLTAFGSYMMAKFNVAIQRGRATDFKSPTQVLSFALDMLFLYTFEAAIGAFLTGNWPEFEDEEDYWKSLSLWAAGKTVSGVMAGVPLARDAASVLDGFGGGGGQASIIEGVTKGGMGAADLVAIMSGMQDDEKSRRALLDLITGMSILTQTPSSQINRGITAVFERDMAVRDDFKLFDMLLGRKD